MGIQQICTFRTDLDQLTEAEKHILVNTGYWLAFRFAFVKDRLLTIMYDLVSFFCRTFHRIANEMEQMVSNPLSFNLHTKFAWPYEDIMNSKYINKVGFVKKKKNTS